MSGAWPPQAIALSNADFAHTQGGGAPREESLAGRLGLSARPVEAILLELLVERAPRDPQASRRPAHVAVLGLERPRDPLSLELVDAEHVRLAADVHSQVEILCADEVVLADEECALEHVAQLPQVPRPVVPRQ